MYFWLKLEKSHHCYTHNRAHPYLFVLGLGFKTNVFWLKLEKSHPCYTHNRAHPPATSEYIKPLEKAWSRKDAYRTSITVTNIVALNAMNMKVVKAYTKQLSSRSWYGPLLPPENQNKHSINQFVTFKKFCIHLYVFLYNVILTIKSFKSNQIKSNQIKSNQIK